MAKSKNKSQPKSGKKPDIRSRKSMEAFLKDHDRYIASGSKDEPTSYANKIDLGKTKDPKAFDDITVSALAEKVASGEYRCDDWDAKVITMLQTFADTHGFMPGFAGANAEYLVLRKAEKDDASGHLIVYPNASFDKDIDYAELTMPELKERAKLIIAFDSLCENIKTEFAKTIINGNLFEIPINRKKKERVFSLSDCDTFLKDNPGATHIYSVPDTLK